MIKEISVFFPAYNEEKNIKKTIVEAISVLEKTAKKYEIIVINDGSKDKTGEIVEKLMKENKNIRMITHRKNKGYGGSLISGFSKVKYEWIVFTDSDGQFDFSEIGRFISTQKETNADLVIGWYRKRRVSFIRKINSSVWQIIVRLMFGLKVKDIDCGFKLIRKKVIDEISQLKSQRGAFISTEFLVKAKLKNFKIVEIPVHHYAREEGAATGANLNVIMGSFKDLYELMKKIKWKFVKFCFIGGTSALISLIAFNIFFWMGGNFVLSVVLSILFSIFYNFSMNRNITFKMNQNPIKNQIWKYGIVYSVSQGIIVLISIISRFFIGGGTVGANIALIIGIAISIPFSFFGSLFWTFRDKGKIETFIKKDGVLN